MTFVVECGVLYVVATPIGNLADISLRACDVLRAVDYIAAEDTRHSKHLLSHYNIETPLISLHEHNELARTSKLLADLRKGKSIALISDAGTPLISDPGFHLLRSLRMQGLRAVPVPGPSSLLAALSIAGLPTDRFAFEGFLPAKKEARCKRLQTLAEMTQTLVFFEAGRRVLATVRDMETIFGSPRQAVIAREMTKIFEQHHGANLSELCIWLTSNAERQRGEFVIVVEGACHVSKDAVSIEIHRLLNRLMQDLPLKQAVAIAAELSGLRKNDLYEKALELQTAHSS